MNDFVSGRGAEKTIKDFFQTVFVEIKDGSSRLYMLLLAAYTASAYVKTIAWKIPVQNPGVKLQTVLIIVTLLLLGLYLVRILVPAVHTMPAKIYVILLSAFVVLGLPRLPHIWFEAVMAILLSLMACGKPVDRLMKLYLMCCTAAIVTGALGQIFGFTAAKAKTGAYGTGLAFGMNHPNYWGSYVFVILIVLWYLYFSGKRMITFPAFWALSVFLLLIVKCRTIAVLAFLFPVLWELFFLGTSLRGRWKHIVRWSIIIFPVLCFVLTFGLGLLRDALVRYTFGTYIENFSKRFIQAGIAFHEHGIPLLGENIHCGQGVHEVLGGYDIPLYVMDNAYASYWIERGALWMILVLIWLCIANHRAIREKNYAILLISICMSLYGLMELFGLDVWYNFLLLYPLAQTETIHQKSGKCKQERHGE